MLAFRVFCVFLCVFVEEAAHSAVFSRFKKNKRVFKTVWCYLLSYWSHACVSAHIGEEMPKKKLRRKKERSNEAHTIQTHVQCRQSIANICVCLRCMVIGNETTKYDCVVGIARSSFATKINFTPKTLLYWMSTLAISVLSVFMFCSQCLRQSVFRIRVSINMRI